MAKLMQLQAKGGAPTLISATQANYLIRLHNALQQIEVLPAGSGTFSIGENKAVLDLSKTNGNIEARLTAIEQALSALQNDLFAVTFALANATIVCNSNNTITLTFPGIVAQD